jgi:hypothetical protein
MRRNSSVFVSVTAFLLCAAGLTVSQPAGAQSGALLNDGFRGSLVLAKQRLDASDFSGAVADSRALLVSAQTPLETYSAASILMQASARIMDLKSEKLAIDGLKRSGLLPAERIVELDGVLGLAHLGLAENREAAAVLGRARLAGNRDPKVAIGHAEALARISDLAGSLAAIHDAFGLVSIAGRNIPAPWYDRAIALAAQQGDLMTQAEWTARKLSLYGTPADWRSGLMGFLPRVSSDLDQTLDLYRLLAVSGGLATERDWLAYAATAERAGAFAEAIGALQTGQAKGAFAQGDVTPVRQQAALRARAIKVQAGLTTRLALALKGVSSAAMSKAGDELLASNQPARAVELYRAALTKSAIPMDRVQVRLGIALARAGDIAGAKAAWAQVQAGPFAPLAGFWTTWAQSAE